MDFYAFWESKAREETKREKVFFNFAVGVPKREISPTITYVVC